jgi:hypothetical protein
MKDARFDAVRREVRNMSARRTPVAVRLAWLTRVMMEIVGDNDETPQARAEAAMIIEALKQN